MSPRTRHRPRGIRSGVKLGVAIVVVLAALTTGVGTTAVTQTEVERGTAIDVAADSSAVVALDLSAAVQIGSTDRLLTITNHFDQPGRVTVTLQTGSTDAADLVVDGINEGDQVTIDLAEGESETIDATVPNESSLVGDTVVFDVDATTASVSATIVNRSVPIEA